MTVSSTTDGALLDSIDAHTEGVPLVAGSVQAYVADLVDAIRLEASPDQVARAIREMARGLQHYMDEDGGRYPEIAQALRQQASALTAQGRHGGHLHHMPLVLLVVATLLSLYGSLLPLLDPDSQTSRTMAALCFGYSTEDGLIRGQMAPGPVSPLALRVYLDDPEMYWGIIRDVIAPQAWDYAHPDQPFAGLTEAEKQAAVDAYIAENSWYPVDLLRGIFYPSSGSAEEQAAHIEAWLIPYSPDDFSIPAIAGKLNPLHGAITQMLHAEGMPEAQADSMAHALFAMAIFATQAVGALLWRALRRADGHSTAPCHPMDDAMDHCITQAAATGMDMSDPALSEVAARIATHEGAVELLTRFATNPQRLTDAERFASALAWGSVMAAIAPSVAMGLAAVSLGLGGSYEHSQWIIQLGGAEGHAGHASSLAFSLVALLNTHLGCLMTSGVAMASKWAQAQIAAGNELM